MTPARPRRMSGQIVVEIRIRSAGDVTGIPQSPASGRIHEVEAAIHCPGLTGLDCGMQFRRGYQQCGHSGFLQCGFQFRNNSK